MTLGSPRHLARAAAVAAITAAATPALSAQIIACKGHGDEITIALAEKRMLGQIVDCFHASFIADMTPCAPAGKIGLSAPTGSAALVEIVGRWQDYADHLGGVVTHSVTPTAMHFAGGFNSETSGYRQDWEFTLDRASGGGTLKREDAPDAVYKCGVAKRGG